ncbi:hypothetical protein UFOVP381_5 [uncultured Caudovirales phage]|uniref:Uncharacterized protein n=1 Tax=uncultured Caudovirales phage TaxID=2100421 RepID=A0A6J7X4J4_9CAUD|nr:hypothetical protein UFOVP381_5 [uncultured Caudovirales phage]
MLIGARTPAEKDAAAALLLAHAGVQPCGDMQALLWVNTDKQEVEWVVGYTGFVGKTCQMHVVNLGTRRTPRKLLWAAFDYPFNQVGVEAVLGIVNSNNDSAIRFDKHLGFKEVMRLDGLHDGGGDIVIFRMNRDECRWIKEIEHEERMVA